MIKLFFIYLSIFLFSAVGDYAYAVEENTPLGETQKDLYRAEHRKNALTLNLEKIEKELIHTQKLAGELAAKTLAYEQNLTDIEQKIAKLDSDLITKQQDISKRSTQMSNMITVIVRMSNSPRQAVLVMPEGLKGQIQAARALGLITTSMREELDELAIEMTDIKELKNNIADKRENMQKTNEDLLQQQASLKKTVLERKKLMKILYGETVREQKLLANLQKQANDLDSLVDGLELARLQKFNSRFDKIGVPILRPNNLKLYNKISSNNSFVKKSSQGKSQGKIISDKSFAKMKGKLKLPAIGKIIGRYGSKKGKNDTIKGVEIKTRKHAQIIAPYGGEVIFTGNFLDYGNVVIIRHSNLYHTVLAGFSSINSDVGQFLLAGEPIGTMGNSATARKLYMELRRDGKAINPAPWLAGYKLLLAKK